MPTIMSHAVVGISAGITVSNKGSSGKFWALSVLCAILPDFDVMCFKVGIPYGHFFGHRGFFHSLFFAVVVGLGVAGLFFRESKKDLLFHGLYFSLVTATHGVLDAFTNGGLGIALLSPFDNHRYFFWRTPISVSPISPKAFLRGDGIGILKNEMLWVWLPVSLMALFGKLFLFRGRIRG